MLLRGLTKEGAGNRCMIIIIIIIMAVTSDEINFLDQLCNIFHILYVSPLNRSLRYFSSFSEFPLVKVFFIGGN